MKALALYSGGLDSILAVKLIERQGIDVVPVHIYTGFAGRKDKAFIEEAVKAYGLKEPVVLDAREEFLHILKSPRYGYGKHLNPCIDCKIFFLRKLKELMQKTGAQFAVTGEVLGQRPMSQNKSAMLLIEKESSLKGLIVRPLSAKLLPPSIPEEKGWIKRDELCGISGRGRKIQLKLAEEFGLKKIPTPAGGCLLTDPTFSRRLKILMDVVEETGWEEIELIKMGRMFLINGCILLVARNEKEKAFFLSKDNAVFDEERRTAGCIIGNSEGAEREIAGIILRYARKSGTVILKGKKIKGQPLSPEEVHTKLVGVKA